MLRVLSIQSHVVHGFVGNKAATFPLQAMGINVDAINTITLSNRPDYSNSCKGFRLESSQFQSIVDGLDANGLLDYTAVLSGYINSTDIVEALRKTVQDMKSRFPSLMYICDPVLGDHGKFYVPEELLQEYKTKLLPLANIVVPNYFEAQELTNTHITSLQSAVEVCRAMHDIGPSICVLKGLSLQDRDPNIISVLISKRNKASRATKVYRLDCQRLGRKFAGCGDLFVALVTASFVKNPNENAGDVLDSVVDKMNEILRMTYASGSDELKIIEGIDVYRRAAPIARSQRSHLAHGPVVGVIFDMDGTLTMPGAIDFKSLYARLDMGPPNYDVIASVNAIQDEAVRSDKWRIIHEEEVLADDRMQLQPGLKRSLDLLAASRVRMSIATRNSLQGVRSFVSRAGLDEDLFECVVSRDCLAGVNKPDPRVALHVLAAWTAEASQVWFVGDSVDDMRCGKGAGCKTCLVLNNANAALVATHPELIDMAVHTLMEFVDALKLNDADTESASGKLN